MRPEQLGHSRTSSAKTRCKSSGDARNSPSPHHAHEDDALEDTFGRSCTVQALNDTNDLSR